jgi:hypothetical protein
MMDGSGVQYQVDIAEFGQTLRGKFQMAVGTLKYCICGPFHSDPVDERRCICN